MNARSRRARGGFAARLLVAQVLVLAAGALTTWLVAAAVGPGIFRTHLDRAGVQQTPTEAGHVQRAFDAALAISISWALVSAVVAALVVSWYFSYRVRRSIGAVSDAASELATGTLGVRVPDPGLGVEFASLADAYNALAKRLESTEATRRRMLADLAHEMRTPLATIDAHVEAVEDGVRAFDANTLDVVRVSTGRLRRLAQDIAAVSRAEEGVVRIGPVPVPAADLARAATEAARDRFVAKGVDLDTDLGCAGLVRADRDRIAQVLGNLLDNALRHTPAGGAVSVRCADAGGWVELVVRDTGVGIGAEHLPHLFDRFYRADTARDREHGGSGIGLSIARTLTEAHGGGIHAESPGPGRGATFTVRLPAAADAAP